MGIGSIFSAGVALLYAAALFLTSAEIQAASVLPVRPPVSGPNVGAAAQSINNDGVVVGYVRNGLDTYPVVWTWTTQSGYFPNPLPFIPGTAVGAANSINAAGLIAGYAQPTDQSTATAVVWTPSGATYTATPLPAPPGSTLTSAYAINATGAVAGFRYDASDASHATVWTPSLGGYTASLLPAPIGDSFASGINSHGDIAGHAGDGSVWLNTGSGHAHKQVIAADATLITSINDNGVGGAVIAGDQPAVMAYFEGDFYAAELDVPFGSSDGSANAVNNWDALAGYVKDSETPTSGAEAALWLPTESFWEYVNLDKWLNDTNPTQGAQWTLMEVTSINDNWLVAGNGIFNGAERGFVMDVSSLVPEPVCVGPIMVAMLMLHRRGSAKRGSR